MQRARTLKTTIGMAFSLGDVITNGYYIEPPYNLRSGTYKQEAPLSKLADTVRSQKACVALLGEPGSGKSTLLGKAFLNHASISLKQNAVDLPFYVSLRERPNCPFDFSEHIKDSFATLKQKQNYPLLKPDRIRPSFYIDGLDEMSDQQKGFDAAAFCKSGMFSAPLMLTCRSRFATRFLNDAAVGSRFSFVVELSP